MTCSARPLLRVLLILLLTPASAAAQLLETLPPLQCQDDDDRIAVLLLGSYHMSNPGMDQFNLEADDVLAPKRQAELQDLTRGYDSEAGHGSLRPEPQEHAPRLVRPLGVDLHAVACEVTERLRGLRDEDYIAAPSVSGEFMMDFYESARAERGYSLRLDILIAYDLDQLVAVPEKASLSFAFKHPDRKREALLTVINVLGAGEDIPS